LTDKRNKAGYKWNGEELERIKPKLELFGEPVRFKEDQIKVGCKTFGIEVFDMVVALQEELKSLDTLIINEDGVIFKDDGCESRAETTSNIKKIINEYYKHSRNA
jgi:hypothetical protein